MKTVHGPEAHITKKHRGDTGPRPLGLNPAGQSSELLIEKEERSREDCKLLAPETALVRQALPSVSLDYPSQARFSNEIKSTLS